MTTPKTTNEHLVAFSFSDSQHMHVKKHNINPDHIFKCSTTILFDNSSYKIIQKRLLSYDENNVDSNIDIILTYSVTNKTTSNMYLYSKNKQYEILDMQMFRSLQIDLYTYDNIVVVKTARNIFT